jgi:hypothetical protein
MRNRTQIRSVLAGVLLAGLGVLACEDEKAVTSPGPAETGSEGAAAPVGASAAGIIPLPVNQTYTGTGTAFRLVHGPASDGFGYPTAVFLNGTYSPLVVTHTLESGFFSSRPAISASNDAAGSAGSFFITPTSNGSAALTASTVGTGSAGFFRISNSSSSAAALNAITNGIGPAINATAGRNYALTASTTALTGNVASFRILSLSNGGTAVVATTSGKGFAIQAAATGSSAIAGKFTANGNFAGDFVGTTKGVRITTNLGGAGLQVINGSKNAVVTTPSGARALYSEEATEVWFSDYGFGKLENGRARILIDPGFAQTVSLDQPYHVFVQPYGDAELYIADRTSLGFVVRGRSGDPSAEFGYRVVAKRQGFEAHRLERAPWADGSAALDGHRD